MQDVEKILKRNTGNNNGPEGSINPVNQREIKNIRREKDAIIRDLITALAVCHNVTPIEDEDGNKSF